MPSSEPMTVLTDYLLAGAVAWFALRLYRVALVKRRRGLRIWSLAFAIAALAAFIGGTWHGVRPFLYPFAERAMWFAVVACIGLASCLLVVGTAASYAAPRPRALLVAFAGGKLVSYLAWMLQHQQYLYVAIDAGVSLLIVLVLLGRAARRGRFGGFRFILMGFAIGALGAMLREIGVSPHRHFNENDLYHVIQIASLWYFYRGALLLRDVEADAMSTMAEEAR